MGNTWTKSRDALKAKWGSDTISITPNGGLLERGFGGYFILKGRRAVSMVDIVGGGHKDGEGRELPRQLMRRFHDRNSYYQEHPDNRGWVFPVFDGQDDMRAVAQRLDAGDIVVHVEYEERVTSCDVTRTVMRDFNRFGVPIKGQTDVTGYYYINHRFARFDVYKVDTNSHLEFIEGVADHLGAFDQDNVSRIGGNFRGITASDITIKTTTDAQDRLNSLDVIFVGRPSVLDFYEIQCREKFFYRVRVPRLENGVRIETVNNIQHRLPGYVDYNCY